MINVNVEEIQKGYIVAHTLKKYVEIQTKNTVIVALNVDINVLWIFNPSPMKRKGKYAET